MIEGWIAILIIVASSVVSLIVGYVSGWDSCRKNDYVVELKKLGKEKDELIDRL